jgi:hypothetical protein
MSIQEAMRNTILVQASIKGVEILKIIASSIRSEQDYGIIPSTDTTVGALKISVNYQEVQEILSHYKPPYNQRPGFQPLILREALNKIIHANPLKSSFFANEMFHDLILSGKRGSLNWIAIISLIDICRVIKTIPDREI